MEKLKIFETKIQSTKKQEALMKNVNLKHQFSNTTKISKTSIFKYEESIIQIFFIYKRRTIFNYYKKLY